MEGVSARHDIHAGGMLAIDDLPPLPPTATIALIGLVLVLWLYLRVSLLRRQWSRGAAQDDETLRAPGFIRRLARWGGAYALFGALAVLLGALLAGALLAGSVPA